MIHRVRSSPLSRVGTAARGDASRPGRGAPHAQPQPSAAARAIVGDPSRAAVGQRGVRLLTHAAGIHAVETAKATTARVAETIRDLVRVSSQGGIDDPTAICEAVSEKLRAAGLPFRILTDPEGRPAAVVSEISGAVPGPTHVLDAVVDTAPIGDPSSWTVDPLAGEIKDGRLYGRGVADSKAAAGLFIELGRELLSQREAMAGKTVLFFDAAEHTGEFQGVKALLAAYPKVDGVMIGYPGDEALNVGSRGFLRTRVDVKISDPGDPGQIAQALRSVTCGELPAQGTSDFKLPPKLTVTAAETSGAASVEFTASSFASFEISLTGTASHSGSSKPAGTNAVLKAARFLEVLGDAARSSGSRVVVSELSGGKHFSQVPDLVRVKLSLSGGDRAALAEILGAIQRVDAELPASQPSRATQVARKSDAKQGVMGATSVSVNVDIRTTKAFSESNARAFLADSVSSAGQPAKLEEREAWPAFILPAGSKLRKAVEGAVRAASDKQVPSVVSGPSNVGNLLASNGIPSTTGFGVAFRGAHAADESIELESIPKALEVYRKAIRTLMRMD